MNKKDLIDFGLIEQSSSKYMLSKLINFSRRPPFYIKMHPIEATNNHDWWIFIDGVIMCVVSNIQEVEKAIWVLSDFRYSTLK